MSDTPAHDDQPAHDGSAADSVLLAVTWGKVEVISQPHAKGSATIAWDDQVTVRVNGALAMGGTAEVPAGADVEVVVRDVPPRNDFDVEVSGDRMQASLTIVPVPGTRRTIADHAPSNSIRLTIEEHSVAPELPQLTEVITAVQQAGVVFGISDEAIGDAIAALGSTVMIAEGVPAVPGIDGTVTPLIDLAMAGREGVDRGTAILRHVRAVPGTPGTDVCGREVAPRRPLEPKLRLAEGVEYVAGTIVQATVDGAPRLVGSTITVTEELVLDDVGVGTGDVNFRGSVRVLRNVGEGRVVKARHGLVVEGNVDRALLESGGDMEVHGAVMKSVLRAGGDRTVAARVVGLLDELPAELSTVAIKSRDLREAAAERGAPISFGLSITVVLERQHRAVVPGIRRVAMELLESGPDYKEIAEKCFAWADDLQRAAVTDMQPQDFSEILEAVGSLHVTMCECLATTANLHAAYVQASQVEATGTMTLTGKGIYNSDIVAWGGITSEYPTAVVRGGSLTSHGDVTLHEIGSPGGAAMHVTMTGEHCHLTADIARAGTVVSSPAGTHRFMTDRSHVKVGVSMSGLNVESLAA